MQTKNRQNDYQAAFRGTAFMLVSAFCYGISPVLVRFLYAFGLNSNSLVFYRTGFAALMLLVPILIGKENMKVRLQDIARIAFIAFFAAGAMLTLVEAFAHTDIGIATSMHFTYPLFVNLIGAIFLGEALTKNRVFSLLLALAGVALLSGSMTGSTTLGLVLGLVSGIFYAIYMVLLDRSPFHFVSSSVFTFYLNVGISLYCLLYSLLFSTLTTPKGLRMIGLMLLLALVNSIIALWTFRSGIILLGAVKAAIISTLEPVVSVAAGALLFQEQINMYKGGGILLVLLSLLVANLQLTGKSS